MESIFIKRIRKIFYGLLIDYKIEESHDLITFQNSLIETYTRACTS